MTAIDPARRGMVTFGLLLVTFAGGLDMTVVNVALAHMRAELSASPEQVTWILTSFMVAQAVSTPAASWLSDRFGAKAVLLACVALFTVTSMLCGLATSLPQMVVARALQGMTAAPLAPLTQTLLFNINPPERHGRAMAQFGAAMIIGPILGPVLGAWLTDHVSWRWCFYINLPAGIASGVLLWIGLPGGAGKARRFDVLGFVALGLALGCFQMMLDRGPSLDWFGSTEICAEALLCAAGLWVFVAHSATTKQPLFSTALIRDRNFVLSTLLFVAYSVFSFGSIALLPLMMQGVMGYPVLLTGLISTPRGLVIVAAIQLTGRLDRLVDRRLLIAGGFAGLALAFWLMGQFDLAMSWPQIVGATVVQSLGMSLVNVPLMTLGFSSLSPELRGEGAAISILVRLLAGGAGIAGMQALTVASGQRTHAVLASQLSPDNPVVRAALPQAMNPDTVQGTLRLNEEVTRQAAMVGYVDTFQLMALLAALTVPLLFLMRRERSAA